MDQLTCVNISVFERALTRGKVYDILAYNAEKNQVKIRTDNNRLRWFPFYCFGSGKEPVAKLKDIHIDDKIERPYCDSIEVTLSFLTGEIETKRWCHFLTPAFLYKGFCNCSAQALSDAEEGVAKRDRSG